jgi:hypothetical protein
MESNDSEEKILRNVAQSRGYTAPPTHFVETYTVGTPPMDVKITDTNLGDIVNHPKHYNNHASGVECITIVRHMNFDLGNAFKYWFRRWEKDSTLVDMEKAKWYLSDYLNNIPRIEQRPMTHEVTLALSRILKYEDAESIVILSGLVFAQFMGNTSTEYRLMLDNVRMMMEREIERFKADQAGESDYTNTVE